MTLQSSEISNVFKLTLYRQVEPYCGDETGYVMERVGEKDLPVELYEIRYGWDETKHAVTCYTYFEDSQEITRKIASNELKEALSQYFKDAIEDVENYANQIGYMDSTFNYL